MFFVEVETFAIIHCYLKKDRFAARLLEAFFQRLHHGGPYARPALRWLDIQCYHMPEASWISMAHNKSDYLLCVPSHETDRGFAAQIVSELAARIRNLRREASLVQFPQPPEILGRILAQLQRTRQMRFQSGSGRPRPGVRLGGGRQLTSCLSDSLTAALPPTRQPLKKHFLAKTAPDTSPPKH